ncbi:M48 family metallopeptidase [Halomicroarcula sp. S3CR25-11]|uniref:M48 family metallopeptidase n=1 Tax=Haloarcula onubensis TaxID=2950539 RepID=A0ABU2FJP5_9EURY|nr:SprT family zinc-dependent metalloprotease [Halomicroarcula sp. S3CR25-11]MDS0280556.1 M48 family metallopeptidase [Halomicroarcula sp. S3CR25-11]
MGNPIEYEVRRSADANEPRIDVDIHGVTVVLPESENARPSRLLKENAAWVVDQQRKYDSYREQVPDRTFEAGECFPLLGQDRELVIESRQKHEVDEDSIRLRKSAVEQSSVKRVLENFYRSRARDYLTDRTDHYAEQMGDEYEKLELRNQRTRWGSCSTGGTISLNWRLIMAPPDVVDYLVVHELAHLTEQHHGREFWELVGEHIPEYKEKAKWLEQNSTNLIFTKSDL